MHHIRKRVIHGALAAAVLTLTAGITPAHAEGYFTSSLSGYTDGGESRRWTDKNIDATSTAVALWGCSGSPHMSTGFRLEVWKDVFGPDEGKGSKQNSCNTNNWGRLASGTYYFETQLPGGFSVSASGVRVDY
ncbi:hypothetical protein [Streptomyces sp. NPDC057939]|uniref:hypothetical protein n=1 Tax=Streptomyces sp. NPDC057939 TaxID=3346284 RepID=UPI0036E5F4B8